MIGVQSYPELYTTLIGWHLYDQLWLLVSQTGLAFLPFIGIVLKNMAEPYESQESKDAVSTSLRRMEVQIISTILIIFLGVVPFLTINPAVIGYTNTCPVNGNDSSHTYHPGDTQTTWDKAFTLPSNDIKVPLWWYAVISVSEGITSAANTFIQCVPNLRQLMTQVDMTQITNPELKSELAQFEEDCYIPARTQYLKDAQSQNSNLPLINNAAQQYGDEDTDWMGSHGFQATYYQQLKSSKPIPGFAYIPSDDINAGSNATPPEFGSPNCTDWWSDPQSGLENRVAKNLPHGVLDSINMAVSHYTYAQDDIIRNIIRTNTASGSDPANNLISTHGYSALAAGVGSWLSQLETYPKIYAAEEAAPIIQSLLLLLIYAFLVLALVFRRYQPSAFITGAIIIFSLIFWSFIWHLVSYVDSVLMNALYGDGWLDKQSPNATLVDMITGILMLVAPLFWFSFMGAMGVAVGGVIGSAFGNMESVGASAAHAGSEVIKSASKKIISSIVK